MAAHRAPLSPGFSRQEYWSGLPLPSPICESEVTQSCPTYIYMCANMYTRVYMYTNMRIYVFMCLHMFTYKASHVALEVKNPPASARDIREVGSVPGWGRPCGGGHGNPLQCSCLENPTDRGAWWITVHGVTKVRHD